MSIKRLVFDYKPVSSEILAHVIGSVQDFFSNYLNNMMKMLELTTIQWYHVDQVTLVSVACDIQTQPFIY